MSRVRRSLFYTLGESYLGLLLQLINTFFIARLLTPTETGVWAVGAVFAALAATLHDFGAQEYIIQEKELTPAKFRAAMAANVMVSWIAAAVLFGASMWIARFYDEPGIGHVVQVQSINFLLIPFGATTFAWFRRNLDYRPFFIASMSSSATSVIVALTCAWSGLGYMSLAWGSLAGVIVSIAVANFVRPPDLPRLPSFKGLGAVLHFGKHATGIYVFGQLGKGAPELIIGRVLGMAPAAFFSRANSLTEIFHRTVVRATLPVCLPYFAHEARRGEDARAGFLRAVTYITVVAWPSFLFLGAMAYPAIRILYGTQWLACVPLAQLLCATASVEIVYLMAKDLLIANQDVKTANYLQGVVQCARVLGLLGVFRFGLIGAGWGLIAAALVGAVFSHRVLAARVGLTVGAIAKACAPSLQIAVLSIAPALLWTLFGRTDEHNFLVVFIACGLCSVSIWLWLLIRVDHPLWGEIVQLRARRRASREQVSEPPLVP